MKLKRLVRLGAAIVLSLSSLLTVAVPMAGAASGSDTCTWTGAGSDAKFSTVANWSNCSAAAPVAGDALVFPFGTGVTNHSPVNDLTAGTSFASITFNGTPATSELSFYELSGTSIAVTGGITSGSAFAIIDNDLVLSAAQTIQVAGQGLELNGVVSGSGDLTKTGTGSLALNGSNVFTGNVTVSAGSLEAGTETALGTTAGSTTVNDGADLHILSCGPNSNTAATNSIAENLTLTGNSSMPTATAPNFPVAKLSVGGACMGGGGGSDEVYGAISPTNQNVTLSGNITLGSDVTFEGLAGTTTLTGALSGNHKINLLGDFAGKLVLNSSSNGTATANGTYAPQPVVQTLSDSQPTHTVDILDGAVIGIDGTRGDTAVEKGGTLKGTGTVGALIVAQGGIVAPGHSPGCLNTGDLTLSGTYQAEIGGTDPCTGYDQIKVTGTVDVTNATLDATLYNGFVPKVGQSYTIISNDGTDAVTGTFAGIAEGGSYTNQGVTYSVTYKGGDGNDVVLTVTAVDASKLPAKPNTGFKLVAAHPMAALVTTTIAALMLVAAARRLSPAKR